MISQTDLSRVRSLRSCSIIEFRFSKMEPEASVNALGFLRKFLHKHDRKKLRLIQPLQVPNGSTDLWSITYKIELLEDAGKETKVRTLQSFLVTFFTDPGVKLIQIIDRK